MEQGNPMNLKEWSEAELARLNDLHKPRTPVVTDRTLPQNLHTQVPGQVFLDFDYEARRRGLAKSMLLKRIVEAATKKPRVLEKLIGKHRPLV
jgi:hypothetical protein